MDLFVQHVGCADVSEVLYPEARHEVLAELEDVKLAATAEIVAFVQRVCGEDPVVSRFSAPLHTASACVRDDDLPSSCADDAESVSDCLSLTVCLCLSMSVSVGRRSRLPPADDGMGRVRQEGRRA